MDVYCVAWAVAVIAFVVAEAMTAALVSVWFIAGSLAALLAALFGAPVWVQFTLFFAVSGVMLALLRPLARRAAFKRVPTNADRIVGASAVVTERIDPLRETGAVRVDGKEWSARSSDGNPIPENSVVRIERIEGVKVIVKQEEES